jgi:hypothetical protein
MAHTLCLLDQEGYTHAHAPGLSHTHARARAYKYNTYCFSTATVIRERASVFRYAYIACLVVY